MGICTTRPLAIGVFRIFESPTDWRSPDLQSEDTFGSFQVLRPVQVEERIDGLGGKLHPADAVIVREILDLANALPTRRWIPRLTTRRTDVGWAIVLGSRVTLGPYEATIFEAAEAGL